MCICTTERSQWQPSTREQEEAAPMTERERPCSPSLRPDCPQCRPIVCPPPPGHQLIRSRNTAVSQSSNSHLRRTQSGSSPGGNADPSRWYWIKMLYFDIFRSSPCMGEITIIILCRGYERLDAFLATWYMLYLFIECILCCIFNVWISAIKTKRDLCFPSFPNVLRWGR